MKITASEAWNNTATIFNCIGAIIDIMVFAGKDY